MFELEDFFCTKKAWYFPHIQHKRAARTEVWGSRDVRVPTCIGCWWGASPGDVFIYRERQGIFSRLCLGDTGGSVIFSELLNL